MDIGQGSDQRTWGGHGSNWVDIRGRKDSPHGDFNVHMDNTPARQGEQADYNTYYMKFRRAVRSLNKEMSLENTSGFYIKVYKKVWDRSIKFIKRAASLLGKYFN